MDFKIRHSFRTKIYMHTHVITAIQSNASNLCLNRTNILHYTNGVDTDVDKALSARVKYNLKQADSCSKTASSLLSIQARSF